MESQLSVQVPFGQHALVEGDVLTVCDIGTFLMALSARRNSECFRTASQHHIACGIVYTHGQDLIIGGDESAAMTIR